MVEEQITRIKTLFRSRCKNRTILANLAFQKFKSVWLKRKIMIAKKCQIHNALVLSLLLDHSNSWVCTKRTLENANVCPRKYLRIIIGAKWFDKVTNEELYNTTNSKPISEHVESGRMKMLEKVLMMDDNSPAYSSLFFALNTAYIASTKRSFNL